MNGEACPLPSDSSASEREAIDRMLRARTIAVVGLSDDPSRPSHQIAAFLQSRGKRVIPVNPNCDRVLGETCHPSLDAVPGSIDLVNVFRRPEHCPDITRQAIAAGAAGIWLQSGIVSAEAERLAREGGIDFVQNRCIMVIMARGG